MIIQVVCVHAKIESVDTVDGVLVILELVVANHDVVAIRNIQSGLGILGYDGIGHPRVFVAIVEMNSVVPIMVHRKPLNENLLNSLSVNANPAFRVTDDAEVAELQALDSFLGIDLVSIRTYMQGRLSMIVFIEVIGGPSPSIRIFSRLGIRGSLN